MKVDNTGNIGATVAAGYRSTAARASRSRREVLGGIGLSTIALLSSACDALSTNPQGNSRPGSRSRDRDTTAKEAPQLAERVAAGKLPPLKQRLPHKPAVLKPHDELGSYGGTWHLFGDNPPIGPGAEITYDWLVRWSPDWKQVLPNLAESWEVQDDGKRYVFHLREGVRWSDGKPFTAADIDFAYNDILLNAKLYGSPPEHFVTGSRPGTMTTAGKYTVTFEFAEPNGLFLEFLASAGDHTLVTSARHYLSQFHIKYNPDATKLAKQNKFDTWYEYFLDRRDIAKVGTPTLNAWCTAKITTQGSRVVFDRNPYYWKTDSKGRQLPYIDSQVTTVVKSKETALLQAEQGAYEFLHPTFYNPNLGTPNNKPILAKNRSAGKYHFVAGTSSTMSMMVLALNLNCKDENLRSVFQNRDFRIGLSYAIDRAEITDAVYQRQGEPWQAAPRRESDFYVERLAKQYTEHDPTKANQYLDKAGYTERDSSGFRLRPDDARISFNMEVITQEPTEIDSLELIQGYWKKVGVDMTLKTIDRSLFYTRKAANLHDANVWTGDGGLRDALIDPRWYFPANGESNFALRWATWYTSRGTDGDEPPPAARQQMKLYDKLRASIDYPQRRSILMDILEIATEQFWAIGTVLPVGTFGVQTDNFHNVPKSMIASWRYLTPGPTYPEQYYLTS